MPDTVGVNVKWAKSNFPVEIDPVRPPRRASIGRSRRSFGGDDWPTGQLAGWRLRMAVGQLPFTGDRAITCSAAV
jgi:hypothetical protein